MDDWHVVIVYESGMVRESAFTSNRPQTLETCLGYEQYMNDRRAERNAQEGFQVNNVYMVVHRKHLSTALRSFRNNEDQA